MLSRRLLLALTFSAAVSSGPAPALAEGPDPAAIVKSIYGKRDPYGAAVSLQMRAPHRHALSQPLAALWKRSDDSTPAEQEPVPGFDIASNSNDREVARAEVKVERQDATRATVAAKLFSKGPRMKYPASNDIVRYDFVRENGRWVIDNVRSTTDREEWSLKGLLNEGLKKPVSEQTQGGLSVREPTLRTESPRTGRNKTLIHAI